MWTCWRKPVTGDGLWSFKSPCQAQYLSLPAACIEPDTELSGTSPALCLPVCHQAAHHDDNGLSPGPSEMFPSSALLSSWCIFTTIEQRLRQPYSQIKDMEFGNTNLVIQKWSRDKSIGALVPQPSLCVSHQNISMRTKKKTTTR